MANLLGYPMYYPLVRDSSDSDSASDRIESRLFYGVQLNTFLPSNFAVAVKWIAETLHAKEAVSVLVKNQLMIEPIAELIFKQYLIYHKASEYEACLHSTLQGEWRLLEKSFHQDIQSINSYLISQNTGLHLVATRSRGRQWDFMSMLHLSYQFPPDSDGGNYLSSETMCHIDTTGFQFLLAELLADLEFLVDPHLLFAAVPKVYSCIHVD